MRQIHLAIFLLFATFGCHLCQSAGNGTQTTTSTVASTTPNSTTTTTPVPTTTTTPTPKTTPKPTPTPTPLPSFISGNVTEDNYTCIRFEFNVHFNIKYTTNNNETKNAILQLPLDSVLGKVKNGTCTAAKESFSLLHSESLINFTMTFAKNENSVYLDSIDLFVKLDNKTFPDINKNKLDTIGNFSLGTTFSPNFNVEKSHSYFCANVTVPKNDPADLQVVFSGLKIQAFMDKTKNGDFSLEHNCQSEINDVVPIAVGAALTSLVLIVLVAYFIGRRRSRRLAYQSV